MGQCKGSLCRLCFSSTLTQIEKDFKVYTTDSWSRLDLDDVDNNNEEEAFVFLCI